MHTVLHDCAVPAYVRSAAGCCWLTSILLSRVLCFCCWCLTELRAACSKERKAGKAPPKRLTTHQRQIVERLVAAHGDDVQVCRPQG